MAHKSVGYLGQVMKTSSGVIQNSYYPLAVPFEVRNVGLWEITIHHNHEPVELEPGQILLADGSIRFSSADVRLVAREGSRLDLAPADEIDEAVSTPAPEPLSAPSAPTATPSGTSESSYDRGFIGGSFLAAVAVALLFANPEAPSAQILYAAGLVIVICCWLGMFTRDDRWTKYGAFYPIGAGLIGGYLWIVYALASAVLANVVEGNSRRALGLGGVLLFVGLPAYAAIREWQLTERTRRWWRAHVTVR